MGEYRDSFNDIHELEVMAGIVLRKKMSHLGELFIFKSKKKK